MKNRSKNSLKMVKVVIPCHKNVSKSGQVFTVYCIEIYLNGKCFRTEKRYRDFYNFHKGIKKYAETPQFPPKKVRNSNSKVIEERRSVLEKYLQEMTINEYTRDEAFHFLSIPLDLTDNKDNFQNHSSLKHQSMVKFTNEMISSPSHSSGSSSTSSLPDIVLKGTLDAFYSKDEDYSYCKF